MLRAWLSVGSNLEREQNIRSGVATLREIFGELLLSQVYESAPVGFEGMPFYNLVAGIKTDQPVEWVVTRLREIEKEHGRTRTEPRYSSRTLDIDLLTYGNLVFQQDSIVLPRPEITQHAFVLKPLAEVAGEEIHPTSGQCYRDLWAAFDSTTQPVWAADYALF